MDLSKFKTVGTTRLVVPLSLSHEEKRRASLVMRSHHADIYAIDWNANDNNYASCYRLDLTDTKYKEKYLFTASNVGKFYGQYNKIWMIIVAGPDRGKELVFEKIPDYIDVKTGSKQRTRYIFLHNTSGLDSTPRHQWFDSISDHWVASDSEGGYYYFGIEAVQTMLQKHQIRKRIAEHKALQEQMKRVRMRKEILEPVAQIVKRAYTEELTDIYIEGDNVVFIILFPVVELTNSERKKHIITDLYVKGSVTKDGVISGTPLGTRGTYNFAEQTSNYTHSHLPTESHKGWGTFCLGDSNLVTLISDIRRTGVYKDRNYFLRRFEAIIFQLEAYVAWESLEGGPHILMTDIHTPGVREIDVMQEKYKVLHSIRVYGYQPPMLFMNETGFQLSDKTENFEEWLVKHAGDATQYKTPRGQYYSDSDQAPKEDYYIDRAVDFMFKGKLVRRKVVAERKHTLIDRKKYCHGNLKSEVVNTLNTRLRIIFALRQITKQFKHISDKASKFYTYDIQGGSLTGDESTRLLKAFKTVSDVQKP
jgi:hypothetical protein